MPSVVARWQDWDGTGLEHLLLRDTINGWLAQSLVIGEANGDRFGAQYNVRVDHEWKTRSLDVMMPGERRVFLKSNLAGAWSQVFVDEDRPLPALDGAIDVDITATPFTNTLPIRRLALEAGQSADITVAYIDVPSLAVTADRQRYTCLEPMRRYRFESQGGEFVREIEVDEHGLVVLYPGLFRRVL